MQERRWCSGKVGLSPAKCSWGQDSGLQRNESRRKELTPRSGYQTDHKTGCSRERRAGCTEGQRPPGRTGAQCRTLSHQARLPPARVCRCERVTYNGSPGAADKGPRQDTRLLATESHVSQKSPSFWAAASARGGHSWIRPPDLPID